MIRIDQNPNLSNAIAKARSIHAKVLWVNGRHVRVLIPNHQEPYDVRFIKREYASGVRVYGVCSCKAGEHNTACYHLPLAAAYLKAIVQMRKAA